jgi:pSer/pThr/pTyr-binding forkhead associated (FHA) protein
VSAWNAEEQETTYKYNCRGCPIRDRCILQCRASPAVKDIMRSAFANRTDTRQMWGILQENCLLLKEEEEPKTRQELVLGQRLREVKMAKEKAAVQEPSPPLETVSRPAPSTLPAAHGDTVAETSSPPLVKTVVDAYLLVQPGGRRIALPDDGELVLGRFPSADVDLTHDDQDRTTVSRRHARISGFRGTHSIEDLSSANGTMLNHRLLKPGEVAPLRSGDVITLGGCQLSYEPLPASLAELPIGAERHYYLLVTATGSRFELPRNGGGVIGRTTSKADAGPDIDLGREGKVGNCVSRRHARLSWEGGSHFLEDLGSKFGTRVSGTTLLLGERVRLKPGDHIWLGGCILAYDLEPGYTNGNSELC